MRHIKFKAKCSPDSRYAGKWVEGGFVKCDESDVCLIISAFRDSNCTSTYHVVPETVCQYSGYNSADDEEIYEGDIIEEEGTGNRLIVVFDDGAFRVATAEQKESLDNGRHPYFSDYQELLTLNAVIMGAPYHIVGTIFEQ